MRLGPSWQGHRWLRHSLVVTLVSALAAVSCSGCADAQDSGDSWVGTWATAPVVLPPPQDGAPQGLGGESVRIQDQTVRQIVHTSISGSVVRVAVSNFFGTGPLEVGAAHLALRADGAGIDAASARPLQFGGGGGGDGRGRLDDGERPGRASGAGLGRSGHRLLSAWRFRGGRRRRHLPPPRFDYQLPVDDR